MSFINFVNFVNMSDVRMIQGGSGFGFLHKTRHAVLIRSNLGRQNLQSNFAIQFCIPREIHLAHSALAQFRADFITAQLGAK